MEKKTWDTFSTYWMLKVNFPGKGYTFKTAFAQVRKTFVWKLRNGNMRNIHLLMNMWTER
ncbi:MAG: hypothetical protein MR016_04710 [Agathobacter sp.]|nr:hypothetical protein [Agathobacter sp.]